MEELSTRFSSLQVAFLREQSERNETSVVQTSPIGRKDNSPCSSVISKNAEKVAQTIVFNVGCNVLSVVISCGGGVVSFVDGQAIRSVVSTSSSRRGSASRRFEEALS